MQIGVVFPQTEIGPDAAAVRRYGERVEELGFRHVLAYDHVVGADPAVYQGWSGPYDVSTAFHEPLVLFGYLAALTRLEMVTGIIILPQRQTVLAAKQAAEVDLLTGGKFRFGIGLGWNRVEYEALGKDFASRGRRVEEQVELLRRLWTEPAVTFRGTDEQVVGAGLAAGAAPDPDLVRCPVTGRPQAGRPAGRRLVPADGARPEARRGPCDGRAGRARGRPRPRRARHGRPGQLEGRRRDAHRPH
jgi:alkanesulfonate monooxygenase SsuD/methylene tetrahydromethanopterin reductase-like flavin-dependent oxidoreductase (luciferase family)